MTVQTWVRGRDDGSEKQAVGEEEVSFQLSNMLHQCHAAIHQQPEEGTEHPRNPLHFTANAAHKIPQLVRHMNSAQARGGGFLPDYKTGNDCP